MSERRRASPEPFEKIDEALEEISQSLQPAKDSRCALLQAHCNSLLTILPSNQWWVARCIASLFVKIVVQLVRLFPAEISSVLMKKKKVSMMK